MEYTYDDIMYLLSIIIDIEEISEEDKNCIMLIAEDKMRSIFATDHEGAVGEQAARAIIRNTLNEFFAIIDAKTLLFKSHLNEAFINSPVCVIKGS